MGLAEHRYFFLVLLIVFLSRLPFVNAGYGGEEDAWAIRLVAERIATTGQYEVSRLPGHPLQELTYALVWNRGAAIYNMLTVLFSTAAIAFFMLSLKKLNLKNYLWGGITLAFVPIIYINSTNALDYTWALSFLMMSLYFLVSGNYWIAGVLIGLAVGCRITSGAMLIPFACFIYYRQSPAKAWTDILKLSLATAAVSLLIFLPVINVYGLSFFQYYEHFPIPGTIKNFYKGTFGVWGTLGVLALSTSIICFFKRRKQVMHDTNQRKIIFMSLIAILIYLIAFIKLPLKPAFMIPLVTFVILIVAVALSEKEFRLFSIIMIASSFFMGINLADPYRAARPSPLSFQTQLANQMISFDFLQGPVIADYLKRKKQMEFTEAVLKKTYTFHQKTLVISGWWLANILVLNQSKNNSVVMYRHYLPETELSFYRKQGYEIFYLPQQDEYNDLRFGEKFTNQYATMLKL